jgi:replicative DNA helicase
MSEVLDEAERAMHQGGSAAPRTWPTGFTPLDTYLGGGLRAGELTLLGGPQGLGKTTFALQMARNVAASGQPVVYFSFEHDANSVLERLVAIESGAIHGTDGVPLRMVRQAFAEVGSEAGLAKRLAKVHGAGQAVKGLADWAERFLIHRSSGGTTTLDVIRERVLESLKNEPVLVVIDYLQKIPVFEGSLVEDERVTLVVEGLKDLALEAGIPILAVVAAEREGLVAGKRLRIHHLRGSSALAYEPDVVLVINDKYDVVARHHLVYDVANAERFHEWIVLTIEKNRSGLDRIDLEFLKRFEQGRFDPDGRPVREQLIDERVFVE